MKTKEELIKHYAQFGVECHCMGLHVDDYVDNPVPLKVKIIGTNEDYVEIHETGRTVTEQYEFDEVWPILRSPKSLTTEELDSIMPDGLCRTLPYEDLRKNLFWAGQAELFKLWKLHVDTFGAIEKGLAYEKH